MDRLQIIQGDCRETLKTLPDESVQCCVTSPPYWGLRDYGHPDQIGQEASPQDFVCTMVKAFSEVRRALKPNGLLWLNLGDSYCSAGGSHDGREDNQPGVGAARVWRNGSGRADGIVDERGQRNRNGNAVGGLPAKNLIGIPWRVAFALQDDGWILRSEITWCKKAPMPESVRDRPTSATEKIFLFSKSPSYFYDPDAVRTPPSETMLEQVAQGYNGHGTKLFEENGVQDASGVKSRIIAGARKRVDKQRGHSRRHAGFNDRWDNMTKEEQQCCGSNMRNFWVIGPDPFSDAHFATFPREIPRRCIMAGSRAGDSILDPFGGSGTTGEVALELGRHAILCELNPDYIPLIEQRTNVTPGLAL